MASPKRAPTPTKAAAAAKEPTSPVAAIPPGQKELEALFGAVQKGENETPALKPFLLNVHKACYANVLADDSAAAVPALFGDGTHPSALNIGVFQNLLEMAHSAWLNPALNFIEFLEALTVAVLDDRTPNTLLPYEEVTTLPASRKVDVLLSSFCELTKHAKHHPAMHALWDAFPSVAKGEAHITEAEFQNWFALVYFSLYTNATKARAETACALHWYEGIADNGKMTLERFILAAADVYAMYSHDKAIPATNAGHREEFYEGLLGEAQKVFQDPANKDKFTYVYEVRVAPRRERYLHESEYICPVDNLDETTEEERFVTLPQRNRVLVAGQSGVGKSALSAALAKELRVRDINVFDLAVEAIDGKTSHGVALQKCIADNTPVSLDIQAALLRDCLHADATVAHGYVLGDIAPAMASDEARLTQFINALGLDAFPQVIVDVQCPDSEYEAVLSKAQTAAEAEWKEEVRLRELAASEEQAKEAENAARAERQARREEREARRAKIDAGELEATPEDDPSLDDPPEEEPQPPVDADGNPYEPEVWAQMEADKAVAVARRKLLADVKRLIYEGRALKDPSAKQYPLLSHPSLQPIVDVVTRRNKLITVASYEDAVVSAKSVVTRAQMQPTAHPQVFTVPADEAAPNDSVDNELANAEILQRLMEASGARASRWQKFCPVAWHDHGVLIEGSALFGCVYRGLIYHTCSERALQRFRDAPHTFMGGRLSQLSPVMLFKRFNTVVEQCGLSEADLTHELSVKTGLTHLTLAEYAAMWKRYNDEVARRQGIVATRQKEDEAHKKLRDDRRKKREKEEKAKKGTKKAKDPKAAKEVVEDEKPADDGKEGEEKDEPAAPTLSDKIAETIAEAVSRRAMRLPVLVSAFDIDEATVDSLYDARLLPEEVVFIDAVAPKAPNAEEEEEEELPPEPEAEEGEEGAKPKEKGPFDRTDDAQYKKYSQELMDRFALPSDEVPEVAEGAPAPLPRQNFIVKSVNVFGLSGNDVVGDVYFTVCPLSMQAQTPGESDEIAQDPEKDPDAEEEPVNPLLVPGKKALQQFGKTLKYCPVTLHRKRMFVAGDPTFWLWHDGAKYLFATEEAMNAFKVNPQRFLPDVPPTVPPLRLWLMGIPGSGRHTIADVLTERYGVPQFIADPDYCRELIAASSADAGGDVRGLHIPSGQSSPYLKAAMDTVEALRAFSEAQATAQKQKDDLTALIAERDEQRENGEEIDEFDEEEEAANAKILEWEPEEEEQKIEREQKAEMRIAANLTRIEPFESKGYIIIGHPTTEAQLNLFIDEGAVPEVVLQMKISSEEYVLRKIDAEVAKRSEEVEAELVKLAALRKERQLQQRQREIEKWRRRNIGGDDEAAEPDEEEIPEDPEPITADAVRGDLEATYENDIGNVSAVVALLPEKRLVCIDIDADKGRGTVLALVETALCAQLSHRPSLLEAPYIIQHDVAETMIEDGAKMLSVFGKRDPVGLMRFRTHVAQVLKFKKDGARVEPEALVPVERPPTPVEKPKRMKKITNDEGEEEEVEEEGEEPEEEPAEAEEPEEEEPEEPELSPEELDEMRAEFETKRKAALLKTKQRAVVLRNRIYFFDTDDNALEFTADPMKYVFYPPPLSQVPTVVALMEKEPAFDSVVKKRNMAEHLAHNLGMVYLNASKLVKWGMLSGEKLPQLSAALTKCATTGAAVSDDLLCRAIKHRLQCADAITRGVVMYNLPRNRAQFDQMDKEGILIHKAIVSGTDIPIDLRNVVHRIDQVSRVSITLSDGTEFARLAEAFKAVSDNIQRRKELRRKASLGFPACIYDASIREEAMHKNASSYGEYCPFAWMRQDKLIDASRMRLYVAEYLGKYYCLSSKEYFADYMKRPETFSGEVLPHPLPIPNVLPSRVKKLPDGAELEFDGCCPVRLYRTRDRLGLKGITEPIATRGNPDFTVEYKGKYYRLLDEEAEVDFMQQPWVFVDGAVLPLPTKLPFDKSTLATASSEVFVRRTMYEDVARAMLIVSEQRPKFPGLSSEESALKFVALYLKAHSEANTTHRKDKFTRQYEEFLEKSTLYKALKEPGTGVDEDDAKFKHNCALWDEIQSKELQEQLNSFIAL